MDRLHTSSFVSPDAQLYLVSHSGQRLLLQRGVFSIRLVQHLSSPDLAAVVAAVGDMQWLVGVDAAVLRQNATTFCFCLPCSASAPAYAVVLSASAAPDLPRLQLFLQTYSRYTGDGEMSPCTAEPSVSEIDRYRPPGSDSSCSSADAAAAPLNHHHQASIANFCSIDVTASASSMQAARMMSAVVKLLSKCLEKGAVRAEAHTLVHLADQRDGSRLRATGGRGDAEPRAVAGVDVVNKVLRAVMGGGAAEMNGGVNNVDDAEPDHHHMHSRSRRCCWTLNREGVELVVGMIRALMGSSVKGTAAAAVGGGKRRSSLPPRPSRPMALKDRRHMHHILQMVALRQSSNTSN